MRHGMPPLQTAFDHGIRPSLSVDVECNMTADMFSIMRTAFTLQRALANERALGGAKNAPKSVPGVELLSVGDRVFDRHRGGKIEVTPKFPVLTRDDLAMAYTPGVGRVCTAISEQTDLVWDYTIKSNSVAVLSDGTAVLGLGDLGPEGAMPVMEGKAMLFKQLANIDAYPLCVRTSGVERPLALGQAIAPRSEEHTSE